MNTVIIENKTGKVLELYNFDSNELEKLSKNDIVPHLEYPDLYIFKGLLKSNDDDTYILKVKRNPDSPYFNTPVSFTDENKQNYSDLHKIEYKIDENLLLPGKKNHVNNMVKKGVNQIAKKFGEEAVELIIESDKNTEKNFKNEAADVLYYFLILIHERGYNLGDIATQLKKQRRNF